MSAGKKLLAQALADCLNHTLALPGPSLDAYAAQFKEVLNQVNE